MMKYVKGFMFLSAVVFVAVCFRDVPRKMIACMDKRKREEDDLTSDYFYDEELEKELA